MHRRRLDNRGAGCGQPVKAVRGRLESDAPHVLVAAAHSLECIEMTFRGFSVKGRLKGLDVMPSRLDPGIEVIEDPGMQDDSDVDELLAMHAEQLTDRNGAPGRIRTCDPRLRRPMLYPTELRAHALFSSSYKDRLSTATRYCHLFPLLNFLHLTDCDLQPAWNGGERVAVRGGA